MTLEQIIRFAIDGILVSPDRGPEATSCHIQELIDILIDYSTITDRNLKDLLKK